HAGEFDETSSKYIHFAVDGAERMKGLIQDLLQYSRLDAAAERFTPVNSNSLLQDVLHLFAASIAESGAVIRYDPLPVIRGNKTQLVQLFQNLIGNALKYRSDKQPLITVSCREEDGRWRFAVTDNGIGIDPKYFQKIFVIFQRLHNKNEYSGSGIGLAICKKIVENHGGKIWVEASPAGGSTFYFTLTKNNWS
ncbi:MAG TPA: ATP-binding protein, partial [Flavisolibacter sp.]|nr:ATP-binding protein [Flavisolibacter sp.]